MQKLPLISCSQRSFPLLGNVSEIPGNEGLAGTFAGLHNNVLLVAGGTAFPEGKPWKGGTKHISDAVLIYERTSDGIQLQNSASKLPVPLGEGASVSLPQGVLCIGGQSPDGLNNRVFLLSWNGNSVEISEYPALPVAVKSPAAAVIGNTVYVIGGENENSATNQFLALDISRLSEGWKTLSDFPLPVSGASAVAQMDGEEISLHVFGGRAKKDGEPHNNFLSAHFPLPAIVWLLGTETGHGISAGSGCSGSGRRFAHCAGGRRFGRNFQ
jgi:solute:Na+ symporter, SSS family